MTDKGSDSSSLIRANLDIECLRENILLLKNCLIDQAGLLKALEIKSDQLKNAECENFRLKQEFINLKETEISLPNKVEELEEEIKRLKFKLQAEELINEQTEFNNEINNERSLWKIEKKNISVKINQKDRKYSTIKSMYDILAAENQEIIENLQKNSQEQKRKFESIIANCQSKLRKKKKKISKLHKTLLHKYKEFEKYRKRQKKKKFNKS